MTDIARRADVYRRRRLYRDAQRPTATLVARKARYVDGRMVRKPVVSVSFCSLYTSIIGGGGRDLSYLCPPPPTPWMVKEHNENPTKCMPHPTILHILLACGTDRLWHAINRDCA